MSEEISFFIDDKPVQARAGEKILWAALDNGIDIPHLCAEREREEPFGACRLCFVEVEGRDLPVLACSEPVVAEMRVQTRSERVDRLRKTAFELLMSHHDLDCKNCARNRSCALQHLAKTLKVSLRPKRFRKLPTEAPVDDSHPDIVLNPNRCILCGKCVWVCNQAGDPGSSILSSEACERGWLPFVWSRWPSPPAMTACVASTYARSGPSRGRSRKDRLKAKGERGQASAPRQGRGKDPGTCFTMGDIASEAGNLQHRMGAQPRDLCQNDSGVAGDCRVAAMGHYLRSAD